MIFSLHIKIAKSQESTIPIFIVPTPTYPHKTDSVLFMAACTDTSTIINPYRSSYAATQLRNEQLQLIHGESSQATNRGLFAKRTMGIQSQQREGSVKKCKKRATKLLVKHKLSRQQAIDAGGVAFIAIEHCAICKAKHLNARGIKTRIPKRSHHKACSKNLKTRGTSEMTVFVNKEAARNVAANRAAIANKTVHKSQKDVSSTYQGFFAERTNHRRTKTTAMVQPSMTSTLSTAVPIADPARLRRELDKRMKKKEAEGDDYGWLHQKKYPVGIGLMVDYILKLVDHRKPIGTATTPQPETVMRQEAIEKYRAFPPPPVLCHSSLQWM
jgi:hypothetical protein